MDEKTSNKGLSLAIVATPIGNLEDITFRALRILKEADLIAAEDTRRTAGLCAHYNVETPLTSYHAHNEHKKTERLLDKVEAGARVAVVTDSGTPSVSDPGYLLIKEALRRGIEPEIIPGPSALTYCVTACGMPVDRFRFHGFPPRKKNKRQKFLSNLKNCDNTVLLFESVHRIAHLIEDIREVCGDQTELAIIREATKLHEERIRGTARQVCIEHRGREWKGELVVAIDLRQ